MHQLFDGHFHIIDPHFTLNENNGFKPDYYTVENYLTELKKMNIESLGGVVVSGSFQGFTQDYFTDALKKLGTNFVGITQLAPDTTDAEIERLDKIGIKGIRFNLYRGLDVPLKIISTLSQRVYDLCGWKTEFYLNVDNMEEDLNNIILSLPKVSIDHMGMGKKSVDLLKNYVSHGIPIRVTGFGRIAYSKEELRSVLIELYAENPQALIFGSDLPSTRASFRFSEEHVSFIEEIFNEVSAQNILYKNGIKWYLGNK